MSSPRQRIPHRRCSVRLHNGHFRCSHWDNAGRCSPPRWSGGSRHTCRPRSGPYRCSCRGRGAGCSRRQCSPHGTHSGHPHNARCHCSHQGRSTESSQVLPIQGHTGICTCPAGMCHGHCSLCPYLVRERERENKSKVAHGISFQSGVQRPVWRRVRVKQVIVVEPHHMVSLWLS